MKTFAFAVVALFMLVAAPADAAGRAMWNTRVLARVGFPGYPAHLYAHPNGRIYEGTYVNSSSKVPSRVLEYDGDGTLLRQWAMQGETLAGEQGVQVATSDAQGRLMLLQHSPPRAVLLNTRTGEFRTFATFPEGAIPNYATWGPDGSLYVTDYGLNQIWKLPSSGGTPVAWLQDPAFSTVEFGTTCIALEADHRTLLIGQQTAPGLGGNPVAGALLKTRIGDDGKPGPLQKVWSSGALDLPDGCTIGRDGRMYVATLGTNQIVVLNPDGSEQERWPPVPVLGDNGTDVPFDALSGVVFRGTSLITASQSNPRGQSEHWALHDVEVQATGVPELIPDNAGVLSGEIAPGTTLSLRAAPARVRTGRRTVVRFTVTAAGLPVKDAHVRFAGRTVTTNAAGKARMTVRLRSRGPRAAVATRALLKQASASVRVVS